MNKISQEYEKDIANAFPDYIIPPLIIPWPEESKWESTEKPTNISDILKNSPQDFILTEKKFIQAMKGQVSIPAPLKTYLLNKILKKSNSIVKEFIPKK